MDKDKLEQDIELARDMTDINSPQEILALVNRLIDYKDKIDQQAIEHSYKADQLKGKSKILQEYIRTGKEHHKNVCINGSLDRKTNNY